jgi:hypothetical protein
MAAPTQPLPSWLSDSTSLATDSAGQATATFTTIVSLPLTYYGPPVSTLNCLWRGRVDGSSSSGKAPGWSISGFSRDSVNADRTYVHPSSGLVCLRHPSPFQIPLGPDGVWVYGGLVPPGSSASNPLPTSVASSVLSSTLATPSSLTATPPTAGPTRSSTSSPSSTSLSPISGESSSHSHHVGEIVGAVLGSVLGSLLLLFLLIFFLRRRQHSQAPQEYHSEPPPSQVMWMWHDVQGHDDDQDGDLDTQLHSAGEGSVQSSGDEHDAFLRRSGDASRGTRDGQTTARLVDSPRRSQDSSGPIGVALTSSNGPTAGYSEHRHVISREQLTGAFSTSPQRPDTVKSPDEADLDPDAPLLPPRTLNLNVSHGSRKSLLNSERSMTPGNDPESALLYTARRVQVGQSSQLPSRPSWPIGIPNILRRSWLNPKPRSTTPTTSSLKSTSFLGRPLTDNEVEAGRSHNAQLRTEMGYREGVRPISGISAFSSGSARSGNTVFYDAPSRENLSSTPSPPVPSLPQGTGSTSRSGGYAGPSPLSADPIRASGESEGPAAYEQNTGDSNDASDILDIPAPRPASPFVSASLTRRVPVPPGLDSSPNSNAPRHSGASSDVQIEVLEEDPPAARDSWRQIAHGLPVAHERRTTFGLVSWSPPFFFGLR